MSQLSVPLSLSLVQDESAQNSTQNSTQNSAQNSNSNSTQMQLVPISISTQNTREYSSLEPQFADEVPMTKYLNLNSIPNYSSGQYFTSLTSYPPVWV